MSLAINMKDRRHAFWQSSSGPERLKGFSLHAIQGNAESLEHYIKDAEGNEGRLARIEKMYGHKGFWFPSLGWWQSVEHFELGRAGFGGVTKELIYRDNPKLVIHDSMADAIANFRESE